MKRLIFVLLMMFCSHVRADDNLSYSYRGLICDGLTLNSAFNAYNEPAQRFIDRLQNLYKQKNVDPVMLIQSVGLDALQMGVDARLIQISQCPNAGGAIKALSPFLWLIAGIFTVAGMLMGVIIPAIPLIWWAMAVIAWMILVVRHIAGGSMLGITMLLSENHSYATYKTKILRAILDLAFTPMLMVLGFIAARLALIATYFVLQWQIEFTLLRGISINFKSICMMAGNLLITALMALYLIRKMFSLSLMLPSMVLNFFAVRTFDNEDSDKIDEGELSGLTPLSEKQLREQRDKNFLRSMDK